MATESDRTTQQAGQQQRVPTVTRLRNAAWYWPILGALVGSGVVLIYPLASAVTALVVAAVGIGLSEGNVRAAARRLLLGGLGMIVPPLAYLVWQIARLR